MMHCILIFDSDLLWVGRFRDRIPVWARFSIRQDRFWDQTNLP